MKLNTYIFNIDTLILIQNFMINYCGLLFVSSMQ